MLLHFSTAALLQHSDFWVILVGFFYNTEDWHPELSKGASGFWLANRQVYQVHS